VRGVTAGITACELASPRWDKMDRRELTVGPTARAVRNDLGWFQRASGAGRYFKDLSKQGGQASSSASQRCCSGSSRPFWTLPMASPKSHTRGAPVKGFSLQNGLLPANALLKTC
jgi:hypothetical protein